MKINRLFLMGAVLVACTGLAFAAPAEKRPNILVILSDDVTDGLLQCYGGKILTPVIDSLAQRGVRFTQFHAASSVCTPSRYSFQTGQYPGRCTDRLFMKQNPVTDPYTVHFNVRIHEGTQTAAKVLRAAGYYTGMVGKWHIGRGPLDLKLPRLDADANPDDPAVDAVLRLYQQASVDEVKNTAGYEYAASIYEENAEIWYMPKAVRHHNMEWLTQGALRFFDEWDQKRPFFLFFASTVRHGPAHQASLKQDMRYTIGGKLESAPNVQAPRDTIFQRLKQAGLPADFNNTGMLWLDDSVAAILHRIETAGELDNTLIFFCSDNGNEPGKSTCYEPGTRVPMIMAWPGKIKPESKCDALVSGVDVVPTIFDVTGVRPPEGMQLDGKSLLPLLRGETNAIHDTVYTEFGFSRAVTDGRWKHIAVRYPQPLITGMENGSLDKAPNLFNDPKYDQAPITLSGYPQMYEADQLYDLQRDPGEHNNLANNPEYASQLKAMKMRLAAYTSTFQHPFPAEADPFQKSAAFNHLVDELRKVKPPAWWKETQGSQE